ncbi:RNA polymerase sigma factor [Actinomadura viridis]|uniref:RNA polymerase sigma-70 factor (ECF subfamily) n=1 Tax=Actinomadura viridis TaxID=58110 RepID=A0A931DRI4_9ACTN|nr:RNA polymerase sigma factor [Actinomadura viridis]MBG6092085.1 RNA polymerase sigma-70 factor (ECF subfamily) [Actinomadura viridis]
MTAPVPSSAVPARAPVEPSDAAVIVASRDDPERFSEIFDRYFVEIHRYVASRLGAASADDAAAETFLTAFTLRHKYDAGRPQARAWLYGIATNLVRRHRRTETRAYRTIGRATAETDHADRVAEMVSAQRMQPRLARVLAGLGAGDRDVLLLIAYGDLSYEEVAQILGIRTGTVGSRLNRARRTLRKALEGDVE